MRLRLVVLLLVAVLATVLTALAGGAMRADRPAFVDEAQAATRPACPPLAGLDRSFRAAARETRIGPTRVARVRAVPTGGPLDYVAAT